MIVRSADAGGFVRVNPAFQTLVGFSNEQLAQKRFLDWIDPRDHAVAVARLEGEARFCRVGHLTRSGEVVPLEVRISDGGTGALLLGRCLDPSERDQLGDEGVDEETVRGTLYTIAQIVEEQNPGYKCSILLVADGRFVSGAGPSLPADYNAAVDGYAIGPTVGSCGTAIYWNIPVIVEDIQRDPLWVDLAKLAKGAGVAACWSHPFTSRSGKVLGALALYAPVPQAPTPEQLGSLRAAARMTGLAVERGRAEEALRLQRQRELELQDQLRQAAKMEALGVLAGGVAHDFNNVIGAILANAEFALELAPANAEIVSSLQDIVTASQRAGNFCTQMLAYAGQGTLSTTLFDLGDLLPQLSSLVQAALSKKATLEYDLYDGRIFIEGDENQLLQVVMNLITNAAEAIGDSQGRIVVRTEPANYDVQTLRGLDSQVELPAGRYVRLTVSDNGCGMDAATVARIFDPFFTTKLTGRGLGLAAVNGIVRGHGGTILLDSQVGVGTTFTVLLPIVETPVGEEASSELPAVAISSKQILVVDDEQAYCEPSCASGSGTAASR